MKGVHARPLALTEVGTHLFLPKHGGPVPIRVDAVDVWPPKVKDPHTFGPILRVYPMGQPIMDVRTGLLSPLPERTDFGDVFRDIHVGRTAPSDIAPPRWGGLNGVV